MIVKVIIVSISVFCLLTVFFIESFLSLRAEKYKLRKKKREEKKFLKELNKELNKVHKINDNDKS